MIDLAPVRSDGWLRTVEWRERIGSTSDLAREIAIGETPLPALVVAGEQTAGRGRGSHRWWSSDGALTFSIALDHEACGVRPERRGLVSVAAAVAVLDAVRQSTTLRPAYKWPNDVLLDGRKLAGLLLESPRPGRLVIGIGLNANNTFDAAPEEVQSRATSVAAATGAPIDRGELLAGVVAALRQRLEDVAHRPTAVVQAAREMCALTGQWVRLADGDRVIEGVCRGIADDGALLIESESVCQPHYAGSVVVAERQDGSST